MMWRYTKPDAVATEKRLADTRINRSKWCVLHVASGCRLLTEDGRQDWVLPRHHASGFSTRVAAEEWIEWLGQGYVAEPPLKT